MKSKIVLTLLALLGLWSCESETAWILDMESTTSENGAVAVDIRIIGKAVDISGNPIENICVVVNDSDYCFTDVDGTYAVELFEYYDAQFDVTFTDTDTLLDTNGGDYVTRTVILPEEITFTYTDGAYQYDNGETVLTLAEVE